VTARHLEALHTAWRAYADGRSLLDVREISANVSTNCVYRLVLDDGSAVIAKVSDYGSYFRFTEDHDRLHAWTERMRGGRFDGFLADVLVKDGRPFCWYDGKLWAAFYVEVERRGTLPAILDDAQIENLACEVALFHLETTERCTGLPPASTSLKSDAIALLDQLESPFATRNFGLRPEHVGVLWHHTHEFLLRLDAVRYDYWTKIPVLIDWNLGNFSVVHDATGHFRLFSRWDYDWLRIEPRVMDFYFLSRVSSATGDRSAWTYAPHTLTEPRFLRFLRAYHGVYPLTEDDLRFVPEVYRFFILNYVVRQGNRFFRHDLALQFRHEAVDLYLPAFERFDMTPLLTVLDRST
jgi:hypothetical protein